MNYRTDPILKRKVDEEFRRNELYGPPPTNPFTSLRRRKNMTIDHLSEVAYVSKQALIRLEQGCFSDPLPSMVDYWTAHGETSELQLKDAYIEFQETVRKRNTKLLGDSLHVDVASTEHPLRQLRNPRHLNPTEVAKALCIPQATIEHFEKKWKTQQSVPKQLKAALAQAGYSQRDIESFCRSYTAWRGFMKSNVGSGGLVSG